MFNITGTPFEPVVALFESNTQWDLLTALAILLIIWAILKVIRTIVTHVLDRVGKKTSLHYDGFPVKALRSIRSPFFIVVAFYFSLLTLDVHPILMRASEFAMLIIVVYYVCKVLFVLIDHALEIHKHKHRKDDELVDETPITFIRFFSKIVLGLIGSLFILANMGVNITSLLAGLGIGGIAIAFALQRVLGDLFSSLSIYFDKPFRPGDYVVVDADTGTVQKVGILSTRIKTLQGQELTIPNSELAKSRINNYRRMERRRIAFTIGVEYSTPRKKVEKIPKAIEDIISKIEKAKFDRAHFMTFGASSLNIDVVYFVESRQFVDYANMHQQINLEIMKYFEKEKINFAFPTQTLHVFDNGKVSTKK
jgi:small-conductance mechanosensitive channel